MIAQPKQQKFKLAEANAFDARRYKRCKPPGVGVSFGRGRSANADFWRDKEGKLFVRFSSQGYIFHLEASRIDGMPISIDDMSEFEEYIAESLSTWLVEGVDDSPTSCLDY